jgi:sugar lactone lactonase YvrE
MKTSQIVHQHPPAAAPVIMRCHGILLSASAAFFIVHISPALELPTLELGLKPGDIIYADSGGGVHGGCIMKVDPESGAQTVISTGDNLVTPFGVALDSSGRIVVSDTSSSGRLIRIDPENGHQSVIHADSPDVLGVPFGLAAAPNGEMLVADGQFIVAMNTGNGTTRIVSSGGNLGFPLSLTVAEKDRLFIVNRTISPEILRIDTKNGAQKVLSRGGYLKSPQAIVARDADLYVTDVATADGNFGIGRVIRIDARTGAQSIVSEGGYLVGPAGIDVDESGRIVVGDPYTMNPTNPDLFDGGIIRIDPTTGQQTLVARGYGSLVNPRGIIVVPQNVVTAPPDFNFTSAK